MSEALNMESANLKDTSLRLTLRLQQDEVEEEQKQQKDTVHLVKSDSEAVESHASGSPALASDNTGGPQTPRAASKDGSGPSESQVERQGWRESSSCSLVMEVTAVEEEVGPDGGKGKGAANRKPLPSISQGKRRGVKRMVPMVPLLSLELPEERADVSANFGNRRGRKKVLDTRVVLLGHSEEDPGSESIPILPVKRSTRKKREIFTTVASTNSVLPVKRPYRKRKIIKPVAENDDTVISAFPDKRRFRKRKANLPAAKDEGGANPDSFISGRGRPGRKSRLPVEIPPELLKEPKEKMIYRCSVCGKDFPHAYKLERHELTHTGERPYSCGVCGRGFNQKGNLKTHYKVHTGHTSTVADWTGDSSPTALDIPEYCDPGMEETRMESSLCCMECGKHCESLSALQAHHVTMHARSAAEPAASSHSCQRCGFQCSDRGQLEQHLKGHAKEKPYSCPDCGKRFINESYIQVHQRIHTGETPYLCSQCGKGYHTASSLKLHEMQHSGERPFACTLCGKRFRINSYLTAHYQTHSKDRPFHCGVCGKAYTRAEELKVHQRLHTGERPYRCGECGKSFIYRQGLRQHQRTHAGKRIGPTRQLGRPKQQARLED